MCIAIFVPKSVLSFDIPSILTIDIIFPTPASRAEWTYEKFTPLELSKKLALLIVIFSPIFAIKLTRLSLTRLPLDIFASLSLLKSPCLEKLISESSLQKFIKSLFFATKSVSLFISIIEIFPSLAFTKASPSEAVLLIFLEALAIPFFLKNSTDFSKSPLVSSSANLQSLKPTPVISRSFLILSSKSLFDI